MNIWDSLSTATIEDTARRLAYLEAHAPAMHPSDRSRALVDVGIRLGWLAAHGRWSGPGTLTPGQRAAIRSIHGRLQDLEARL